MNYATSTASSQKTGAGQLTAGFLAAGVLFVVGYTFTRVVLMQPAIQGEDVVINSVAPNEASLWNTDVENL